MMNVKRFLLLLAIGYLHLGLQAQSIKCYRLKVPKVAVSAGQKIAVVEYHHSYNITEKTGNQGKLLANYVAKTIEHQNRPEVESGELGYSSLGANFHTIVSRTSVDSVVKALQIKLFEKTSDDDLFRIGEALGADLVLFGGNRYTVEREYYEKQEETLSGVRTTQHVSIKVECSTYSKLYAVKDKNIMKLHLVYGNGSASGSFANEQSRMKVASDIERKATKQAYRGAAVGIVNTFTPSLSLDYARFKNTKNKKYQKDLKKHIRKGNANEIHQVLQKIVAEEERNAMALYNLGLINELVGNFADASNYYDRASDVDDKYDKAKRKVSEILDACQTYGIPAKAYSFENAKQLSQSE